MHCSSLRHPHSAPQSCSLKGTSSHLSIDVVEMILIIIIIVIVIIVKNKNPMMGAQRYERFPLSHPGVGI